MAVARPDFYWIELAEVGEAVVVGAQQGELLVLKFAFEGAEHFEATGLAKASK